MGITEKIQETLINNIINKIPFIFEKVSFIIIGQILLYIKKIKVI